jgi:hypothetical protein
LQIIRWQNNKLTYLRKHIPEMFKPYEIAYSTISDVIAENDEQLFLLECLDKGLLKKYIEHDEAKNWLNEPQYFTDERAPQLRLNSIEGASKLLSTIVL